MLKRLLILLLCCTCGVGVYAQTTLTRSIPGPFQEVPVASAAGPVDRETDHATVAMNRQRDIAVAYHASRPDITGSGNMKQVEVALFAWQGNEQWEHVDTVVVGAIGHDPLHYGKDFVKCERPDIIAVGDRFFVVWTRRYQGAEFQREPAVLECAWIGVDDVGDFAIYNNDFPIGRGVPLDAHDSILGQRDFWVKDCAGVPDAVVLSGQGGAGQQEVAVIYPHQTEFTADPSGDRSFEQRLVTCSLDDQGHVARGDYKLLHTDIPFDGPMSPNLAVVPGLILPDAAPSPETDAFWLAFEWQTMEFGLEHGRVQLEYWQRVAGEWIRHDSVGFRSPTIPIFKSRLRRRPNLDSLPVPGQTPEAILAFNKVDPHPLPGADGSTNVVLSEVQFDGQAITATSGNGTWWPNGSAFDDGKPVPMVSRPGSGLPTCFAGRTEDQIPGRTIIAENLMEMDTGNFAMVARPSVAYRFLPGAAFPDYVAMSLEKRLTPGGILRVWIGVH
ncbi:MAG: hypothetical protein ACPG31_10085 [Planctomycetota bacterium]